MVSVKFKTWFCQIWPSENLISAVRTVTTVLSVSPKSKTEIIENSFRLPHSPSLNLWCVRPCGFDVDLKMFTGLGLNLKRCSDLTV